jgi:hypothetical protein
MTIIEKSIKEHEGAISIKLTADVINGATEETSEPKKKNARGGIYSSEIWTKFAEDGPEAAIPIDGSERAKSLWKETGARLGMFSNNSGGLSKLASSLEQGGQVQNTSEVSTYNFNYSPNVVIEGKTDQSTVVQALSISRSEFEKQMKEYTNQKNRVSFG